MVHSAFAYESSDGRHPMLAPGQLAGDDVWYVQIVFPDGRIDRVGVFRDKSETVDWIARKSAAWLSDYEIRRTSDPWDRGGSPAKARGLN